MQVTPPPARPIDVTVRRVPEYGTDPRGRELTAAQVAADPIATSAVRLVRAFEGFLAQHGAVGERRLPTEFAVSLQAGNAGAAGARSGITLGYAPWAMRQSTARSAEIVGHELAHAVSPVRDMTSEGWADVVGLTFARSLGAPTADDWLVGNDTFTAMAGGLGAVRDVANPKLPRAADVLSRIDAEGEVSVHDSAGPLRRAAYLLAQATSPATMGRIFTTAFVHDLALRTAQQPHGSFLDQVRNSAAATLDAAARLHGATSPERAAVARSWREVGVDDTQADISTV